MKNMEKQDSASAKRWSVPQQEGHCATAHHESQRYKHDIEQADGMRRRSANTSTSRQLPQHKDNDSNPAATEYNNNNDSEKDVAGLGLRGLDEADTLREEGHIQCALDLYLSAIDVLIRYLRDPTLRAASPSSPRYDTSAIEARLNVALTDAEQLKQIVKRDDRKQQPSEASTEASPMKKTCFSKIKEYLSSIQSNSNNSSGSHLPVPTVPQPPPALRSSRSQIGKVQESVTKPQSSINKTAPGNQNQSQQRNALQEKESDSLAKTVFDDMYIPHSEMQSITWDDIAGLKDAKQALQESAIMPLLRPDLFTGLRKPQNILLYGSPGTGKTMLVKAVAHESQCNLFVCTASAVTSKWHGEGEKLVRALFKVAKESAPSIVFMDEIDALLSTRKSEGEHEASRRFKTEFMVQMDSISSTEMRVLLIACTNCPWDIDGAILRRFPKRIFVPLPDKAARKALLKSLLKKAGKHSLSSSQISDLVKRVKGFSGSDLQSIASEAAFGPLRSVGSLDAIRRIKANDVRPISIADFESALQHATKSVPKELLKRYEDWNREQAA